MTTKSRWVELEVQEANELCILKAEKHITCSGCDGIILPDKYFSRSADKKGTKEGIRYAWCSECRIVKEP